MAPGFPNKWVSPDKVFPISLTMVFQMYGFSLEMVLLWIFKWCITRNYTKYLSWFETKIFTVQHMKFEWEYVYKAPLKD